MASEAEWAWAAGIIEGEGCIAFTKTNSVCVSVQMTDRDVVERLRLITGTDLALTVNGTGRTKPLHRWAISRASEVARILTAIRPWLGERRGERADEALIRVARVKKPGTCKRGHDQTDPANIYTAPDGRRYCRPCLRLRDRQRRVIRL